jgi:competence protein ComEC
MRWDDLVQILNHLRPDQIQLPDYAPETDEGKRNKRVLDGYDEIHSKYVKNVTYCSKDWHDKLSTATAKSETNIAYRSKFDGDNKNDKSLIRLFRSSGFNVVSFGDCESKEISDRLGDDSILKSETDIMILAHHGADNGFTNEDFLKKIRPILTICSSNYDNQYEHPKQEIKDMLYELNIPLFTTKTGDVIVYQEMDSSKAIIYNLISDNTQVSTKKQFTPKRFSV